MNSVQKVMLSTKIRSGTMSVLQPQDFGPSTNPCHRRELLLRLHLDLYFVRLETVIA